VLTNASPGIRLIQLADQAAAGVVSTPHHLGHADKHAEVTSVNIAGGGNAVLHNLDELIQVKGCLQGVGVWVHVGQQLAAFMLEVVLALLEHLLVAEEVLQLARFGCSVPLCCCCCCPAAVVVALQR
jgi:hypothetical protein